MLWLALSLLACDNEARDDGGDAPACAASEADDPFAIEASASGRTLTASLRNVSPLVRNALHHAVAQPSEVVLIAPDDDVIAPIDDRTVEDTALVLLPKAAWVTLDPCDAVPLGESTFAWEGDGWGLAWGPFRWSGLDPGRYTAIVTLPMRLEHYDDPMGSRRGIREPWTGEVRSEPVEIVLPGVARGRLSAAGG